jgi:hypothetical protein
MQIHKSPHFIVVQRTEPSVLTIRRTTAPFVTLDEMRGAFDALNRALDAAGRSSWSLLVDTRDAPSRNDSDFEAAFAPLRQRMLSGFRRVAVLARTTTGKLQIERHARSDRTAAVAFTDEASALDFLSRARLPLEARRGAVTAPSLTGCHG